jgi:AGCS family alanine or glycine:cation symporter
MPSLIERLADGIASVVTNTLGPIANFLEGYVWNWPPSVPLLAVVLLGTGFYVTLRLAFVQVRGFKHAIAITRGKYDDPNDEGDLRHFQALTTALSATVGIGNIAGVAIAIRMGGPGALFWMWVTAFFGMALKFAECTLAQKYREVHPDGSVSGGPMYYIEKGLKGKWGKPARWMALFFAGLCVISSFGSGNMNQSNTMAVQVEDTFGIPPVWTSLIFAILVGTVIIGGIKRIGKVTAIVAPAMGILYVVGALVILMINIRHVPSGLVLIVTQAFAPSSLVGGGVASFLLTLMWGVRRGLFSNEAGQGSAPIAHATAKTDEPVREGLVASLEPFIDTLVICTMTGLVVVTSGAYLDKVEQTFPVTALEAVVSQEAVDADLLTLRQARPESTTVTVREGVVQGASLVHLDSVVENLRLEAADGSPWNGSLNLAADGSVSLLGEAAEPVARGGALHTGAELTALGFTKGMGHTGKLIVTLAVLLFAVSTAISWSYYGDRATEYLFGSRFIPIYRWVFVGFFFLGGILPLQAVWTMGDVALGLMSFPNLIALILLSGSVTAMSQKYFAKEQVPNR